MSVFHASVLIVPHWINVVLMLPKFSVDDPIDALLTATKYWEIIFKYSYNLEKRKNARCQCMCKNRLPQNLNLQRFHKSTKS